jgi:threonine/homoserine/homoserine lactone efflux protein
MKLDKGLIEGLHVIMQIIAALIVCYLFTMFAPLLVIIMIIGIAYLICAGLYYFLRALWHGNSQDK